MIENLINLILLFFAYSFAGWWIEVILKYRQFHRFVNRGFLAGPWLPIYGFGAALITVSVYGMAGLESAIGTTFVISFFVCGIEEYMVSYVLEKRYHARWWDYSTKPMNLNGRVWIGNLLLFGIGGVLIIEGTNPILHVLFENVTLTVRGIVAFLLSAGIITDFTCSHFIMKLVKTGIDSSEADDTETINAEIRLLLSDKSIFYRRFANAYPEVIYRTERVKAHMEEVRLETERMRAEAESRLNDMNEMWEKSKEQFVAAIDPVGTAKNKIINKQDLLIQLLYDEGNASPEARELVEEIAKYRAVIDKK